MDDDDAEAQAFFQASLEKSIREIHELATKGDLEGFKRAMKVLYDNYMFVPDDE